MKTNDHCCPQCGGESETKHHCKKCKHVFGPVSDMTETDETPDSLAFEKLRGGKGDDRPDDAFDPEQLATGVEVEMEHTDDPELAKEIAKDHLTEDESYYRKLRRVETFERFWGPRRFDHHFESQHPRDDDGTFIELTGTLKRHGEANRKAANNPQRIASKIATLVMHDFAKSGFTSEHEGFRMAYSDLEDDEKKEFVKELSRRGMLSPVIARKKKPPTSGEVYDDLRAQAKRLYESHSQQPTNRHVPFIESEAYRTATSDPKQASRISWQDWQKQPIER